MIGLALASHTFLNELEDRRCKKLGHLLTPDQSTSQHRRCSRCIENIVYRKSKSKKPKRFLSNIMFKHESSEKPSNSEAKETAKSKSPSITSSSSAELFTSPIASPTFQYTSTPIESPIQRETILAPRAHRLLDTRELSTKIYREVYEDRWNARDNPQGRINLCTAENNLCEDLLEEKLNNPQIWSGAIQSLHHYSQSGGFDWVKQAAINYVERFISTIGDPGILSENVTIVPGCRAAYDMLGFCLFEPGDAILTFVPFYSRLVDNLEERAQVRIIPVEFEDFTNPRLSVDLLKSAYDNAEQNGIHVKAISINNPHNPLGYIFSEDEILNVCKWAVGKDLFIIADEVFATTVSCDNRFRSLLSIRHKLGVKQRKKVIWMWSVSKDLCLPGARFALIHAENKDLQKGLRRLEIMQPCAPVVQHLIGTLFSDIEWFTQFNEIKNSRLQNNREFAMSKLDDYGIKYFSANSALFIFINLTEYIENDTFEAEQKLWKRFTRAGVYLNPGCLLSHSTCGWFRMVISVPMTELEEGIKRLHAIILAVEKREVRCKSVDQLEIPSQPISSATSEDELMKLIFPKNIKIKSRAEETTVDIHSTNHSTTEGSKSTNLLDEVFAGRELNTNHSTTEETIKQPEIEVKSTHNKETSSTASTENIYATIYETPTPKSSVVVVDNKQPTVHQTSIIKDPINDDNTRPIKTTIQSAELPQQHLHTVVDPRFEELPEEIYAPIQGKNNAGSKVKVQKRTESQTTTYISKPQQIQTESKSRSSPHIMLSNDVFDSIFVEEDHPTKPNLTDQTQQPTTTVQESDTLPLPIFNTTKLQEFEKSVTTKSNETLNIDPNSDLNPEYKNEFKYVSTKHDSGIEMADYKLNLDSKANTFESQQISEEQQIFEEQNSMPNELYEAIFEPSVSIEVSEKTLDYQHSIKSDKDSQITTDMRAFSKQQPEVKRVDKPTLPEHLIDDILEPKNYQNNTSGGRRSSEDLLETVFKPSQSLPSLSIEKKVSHKSDKDDQITTDFSAFSRSPIGESSTKSMPTLSDDVFGIIFEPDNRDKHNEESTMLSNDSWVRVFERPSIIEASEKTLDYRHSPKSDKDDQITTDMSAFSRHQHVENKRQIGKPTLSNKEVGSILQQLWSKSSDEESSDESNIHVQKEVIVTEVHSPTFTQQFEYVEMHPQQTEDILTKAVGEQILEPLKVENEIKSDDLLDKIFEQQIEFTQPQAIHQSASQLRNIEILKKDRQINDGLSFPKQVPTEKHALNEPTLSDDVYDQIFEMKNSETKPPKVQKHVRIAEVESNQIAEVESTSKVEELKTGDEYHQIEELKTEDEIGDLEKYGKLIDANTSKSSTFKDEQDEFAKVFEDKEEVSNDFDDDYSIKPILTDFSFIEELVNESILRRHKQQYRPEMDLWRMSIVEETSETSATPKGSTGSPISRRSLRDSIKEKSTTTESPLNEDIFKSSEFNEEPNNSTDYKDVIELPSTSDDDKVAQQIIDDVFQNLSTSPNSKTEPLHIDVHNEPLQTSTLKRGQFNDNKLYETNDSGIGMDVSSGGSLTIEFPLFYSSEEPINEKSISEKYEKPIFSSEELNKMLEEPLDHWPKSHQKQETPSRPKFESFIQSSNQRNSLLKRDNSAVQTPPIYSEADIWGILGTAQEKQDVHQSSQSSKGAHRQILKKKRASESSGAQSDETYDAKLTSSMSSESLTEGKQRPVNLNVKLRSFSPSPLNSSQSSEAIHSTSMQVGPTSRSKLYQKRRPQRSQSSKSKATQQGPSFTGIIDSYNKSLKDSDEILPKVCITSHHRYKKATVIQSLSRSEDPLMPEASQVHHKMFMERRPKSHSPHSRRHVIIEHTNITEIAYDSKSDLTDAEKPEIIKTKASTRVNSLGTNELLNSIVFNTEKEPPTEKVDRCVELKRHGMKGKDSSKDRTSEFIVEHNPTEVSSADDSTDFTRTRSGRIQRGIQTRSDPLDLCCKMRLIQSEKVPNNDRSLHKEFVMCKNLSHTDKHDHCNPKRLYVVKRSTIPKNAVDSEHPNIHLSPDSHDIIKVSNSSDSTSSNSIDRVTVRHTPGSKWIVSSICKTAKFGFDKTTMNSKRSEFSPIRSKLYKSREPSGPHSD